jgi:NADPH:quinone reductase-like Zn-dependent oxidoreductase
MAAYQILKANGLKSGDVVALDGKSTLLGSSVAELGKAWGIQVGSAEAVGTKGAKLALSLVGTSSFSALANSLVEGGTMLVAVPASADAHFLPSAALATKCIRVQGFSVSKALQGVGDPQVEPLVQELSEMVAGGKFKNSFIKHEFANVLECVNDVSSEVSKGVHWLAIN